MSFNYDQIQYLKKNINLIQTFLKENNLDNSIKKEKVYSKFNDFCNKYSFIADKIINNDLEQINQFIQKNDSNLSDPKVIKHKIKQIQKYLLHPDLNKIKHDKVRHEVAIREKFPLFEKKYPFLIKRVINGDDLSMLDQMLNSIEKVRKGNDTLQNVEVDIGKTLFKDIIIDN